MLTSEKEDSLKRMKDSTKCTLILGSKQKFTTYSVRAGTIQLVGRQMTHLQVGVGQVGCTSFPLDHTALKTSGNYSHGFTGNSALKFTLQKI